MYAVTYPHQRNMAWKLGLGALGMPIGGAVMPTGTAAPTPAPTAASAAPATTTPEQPLYLKLSTTPLAAGVPIPTDTDTAFLYTLQNIAIKGTTSLASVLKDPVAIWNDLWAPAYTPLQLQQQMAMGSVRTPYQGVTSQYLQDLSIISQKANDPNLHSIIAWASALKTPRQENFVKMGADYWHGRSEAEATGISETFTTQIFPLLTVAVITIMTWGVGTPFIGGLAATALGAAAGSAAVQFGLTPSAPAIFEPTLTMSANFNENLLAPPTTANNTIVSPVAPVSPMASSNWGMTDTSSAIPLTEEQETAVAQHDDMLKGLLVVGVLGAIVMFGGR